MKCLRTPASPSQDARMSMRIFPGCLFCCAVLLLAQNPTSAQLPAIPGPAATPPVVPAPPTKNIYTFLLPSAEQRVACRMWLANCPPVQLLDAMLRPVGLLTGGVVPPLIRPGPSPANLAKPPTSAAGAAAKIQAQEAEAKARREYIRYLGTVDCRYYPEAEAALAAALRTDPSECVRYEAVMALTRGCCCTKKTVAALKAAASGGSEDQNPPECSERVRAAAEIALIRCETAHPPITPTPQLPLERPIPSGVEPVGFNAVPSRDSVPAMQPRRPVAPPATVPTGQHGLLQITRRTLRPGPAPVAEPGPPRK